MFESNHTMTRIFPYAKWAIYGLLFFNMVLFFLNQTILEALDSLAWLALLLLLELETSQMDKDYVSKLEQYLLQGGRVIAYLLIVYSTYEYGTLDYIEQHGFLDVINSVIWLSIAILIEYEIFYEKIFHQIAIKFLHFLKIGLYVGLFIVAFLWQVDGELLDFYDASLWIVCFFFIELNILQFEDKLHSNKEVTDASY